MLFALGAASAALNMVQSLASSASSSASSSSSGQASANPFEISAPAAPSTGSVQATGFGPTPQISPATLDALLAAQGQSSTAASATGSTSANASIDQADALQSLFSQIDGNGDGAITKSEFENALGAGGTNLAQADDVFTKLDTNDDGTVSLDELSSALKNAGGHHGHHHAMASSGSDEPGSDGIQSSTSASSDATAASGSAVASYASIGQLFQREASTMSLSIPPLSFSV